VFGGVPFTVGAVAEPHVLICIDGSGEVEHGKILYPVSKGDVWLLPAEAGVCAFRPSGSEPVEDCDSSIVGELRKAQRR
jgi:hypothetical protein